MILRALWLPGDFPTTNKLLDLQRATGFLEGAAKEQRTRVRKHAVTFPKVVAQIRNDTHMRARACRLQPVEGRVPLFFVHMGSGRRDPSSWYLSAKAVEDGLVDAGVLRSDRFNVLCTAGRSVAATDPVWRERIREATGVDPEGKDGMFVTLGVMDDAF